MSSCVVSDPSDHIRVGCFYEIDHSVLTNKYPDQLKCVRVVMVLFFFWRLLCFDRFRILQVNEKTRMRVSLRYPSICSLRSYVRDGSGCSTAEAKNIPALDEKCMIGSEVAADALYRRILPAEMAEKKRMWSFWVVPSIACPIVRTNTNSSSGASSSLLSELKTSGVANWGLRRKVTFLGRCVEEEKREDGIDLKEEEDEEEDKNDDSIEEDEEEEDNHKRKLIVSSSTIQLRKRPKHDQNNQIVVYRQRKKKVLKNAIDRWSAERYKLAEVNMLKIMKEEGIVFGNSILRADLRTKARKMIGDTGLLDHLLKHMAGKVAPGGEERFRRRHNAEGSMEYWLEKADLADIRKEAGVSDPYWIPPPGWKPGDNPSMNPVCASEINILKDEIEKLKRSVEELRSTKQEEELAVVNTPISSVTSFSIEQEGFLIPLKEMFIELTNKKARIDEQLNEISQSLSSMEVTMAATKRAATAEDRASKIQRLKSGFTICNPGANFLWPSMASFTPQTHLDGVLTTPSSASSSSTVVLPPPVIRPIAERRAVTVVVPSIFSTPRSRTPLINLNEEPSSQNDTGLSSSQGHGHVSPCHVTYQRRTHQTNSVSIAESLIT
ncbi:Protein DYAD [Linum perenne]